MTDNAKPSTGSKGIAALISILIVVSAIQSLFLFKLWRETPHERKEASSCSAAKPIDQETNQGKRANEKESALQPPRTHLRGTHGLWGDPDELLRDFDTDNWDPFEEFKHIRERMDSLFDDSFGRLSLTPGALKRGIRTFSPSLDLQDKGDHYVARMDIPGTDRSNLSVTVKDRVLTVSGQINEAFEKEDGDHVLRKERHSGKFQRSVTLPGAVMADAMTANYESGVLTITIPKAKEDTQSKTVEIQ